MGKRNISLITNVDLDQTTATTANTKDTTTAQTTPTKRSRLSTLLTASTSLLPSPLSDDSESRNGLNILLVDDNQINLDILRRNLNIILVGRIKRLEEARNGLEAIKLLNVYAFDFIFMDIDMPIMDGIDTTIQIRNNRTLNHANIPIIAITTNDSIKSRELYKSVGMNDCLSKPVNCQLLQQSLSKFLTSLSAGGTLTATDAQTVSPLITTHTSSIIFKSPTTRSSSQLSTANTKRGTVVSTITTTTTTTTTFSESRPPPPPVSLSPPSTPTDKN